MPIISMHSRNVTIAGRRTSLKLEADMWDALFEIGKRERSTIHQLCTMIAAGHSGTNLTAAVRVFILAYFRAAATEVGHSHAGHGGDDASALAPLQQRAYGS